MEDTWVGSLATAFRCRCPGLVFSKAQCHILIQMFRRAVAGQNLKRKWRRWEKQGSTNNTEAPKENGKRGLPGGKPQEPLLFVQLLLCVWRRWHLLFWRKSMDAVFFSSAFTSRGWMLSQGVDTGQENTFAHVCSRQVEGFAQRKCPRGDGAPGSGWLRVHRRLACAATVAGKTGGMAPPEGSA